MDDPPAADETAPAEEPGAADDVADDDAAAGDTEDAGVEPEGGDAPVRPPLEQRAATLLVRLAAVGLAIVVVTGIPLIWRYHPGDIVGLRAIHVLGSTLLLGAVGALALVTSVAAFRRRPVWTGWGVAFAGFAAAALGSFSGSVIAWDLLVVRNGTTAADLRRGAFAPLSDGVHRVIVGTSQMSPGTYRLWLAVHVLLVSALAALALWLVRRRMAPRSAE